MGCPPPDTDEASQVCRTLGNLWRTQSSYGSGERFEGGPEGVFGPAPVGRKFIRASARTCLSRLQCDLPQRPARTSLRRRLR